MNITSLLSMPAVHLYEMWVLTAAVRLSEFCWYRHSAGPPSIPLVEKNPEKNAGKQENENKQKPGYPGREDINNLCRISRLSILLLYRICADPARILFRYILTNEIVFLPFPFLISLCRTVSTFLTCLFRLILLSIIQILSQMRSL